MVHCPPVEPMLDRARAVRRPDELAEDLLASLCHAMPCQASGPKLPLMSEAIVVAFTVDRSW